MVVQNFSIKATTKFTNLKSLLTAFFVSKYKLERYQLSLVQCRHFADKVGGGSSDAYVRSFWCKPSGFLKFMVCTDKGEGVKPVQTFCGQAGMGSQFFAILCGRLL